MAMEAHEIESLIRATFPDAKITITDTAGDGNHWAAEVVDESFRGMNRVQQQRAVYASLNTRASVRSAWGLDADLVERIRAELVRGGTEAAAAMVPSRALDDLLVADASPDDVSTRARTLGVTSIAVPGFSVDTVEAHVTWARAIEAQL